MPHAVPRGCLHRQLRVGDVGRATPAAPRHPSSFRVMGFHLGTVGVAQRPVTRRHTVIRGALEHVQLRCGLGDDRNRLDARGSRANDGDALAGEVHRFVRPGRGVVDLPGEGIQTGERRSHRRRQRAGGHHAEPGGDALARLGGHRPAQLHFVEHGGIHAGVQGDVAAQIQPVGDPIDVGQNLGLGGVLLRPIPLPLQRVGERVAVVHALDVASGPGIAVEVPGAADVRPGLEHPDPQAVRSQFVQRVQAGEARADDHHIDIRGCAPVTATGHGCLR